MAKSLSALQKKVRSELLKQAKHKGRTEQYIAGLIDGFVNLLAVEAMLIADIAERGVTVQYGQNLKKNDSVAELTKVQSQMQKTLDWLGVRELEGLNDGQTVDL